MEKIPLSSPLVLAVLSDLISDGFQFGTHFLVEYEPDSLWYEMSLTVAARALGQGIRTEYHVMQHVPDEVRNTLERFGPRVRSLEKSGLFRIIDWYTPTTVLPGKRDQRWESWPTKPRMRVRDWITNIKQQMVKGVSETEKRWLHIDDNSSILLQYLDEKTFLDFYRTSLIPWMRAREVLMLTSLVTGVASNALYGKLEALCDGIIDLKSDEEDGRLEHYVRVRIARGKTFDSEWRRLRVLDNSEVALSVVRPAPEFKFATKARSVLFDYLADSFIEDYMVRRFPLEKSGWRSLVEMARGTKISTSVLYGSKGGVGQIFNELIHRGLIEERIFPGERGRGGRVMRFRVAYDKEPVKATVDRRVRKTSSKTF
jgi:KaiC/GvpD/RAD55 family RecA-like ATPase